jgi:hypothetical protein
MPGRIRFSYRALLDVVVADVDWTIDTEDDVAVWYEEYKAFFSSRFTRKVDLILELSKFRVSPRVGAHFGECRARILAEFTRRSYRVNQGARERTFMYTSSALHGAPANNYETVDEAIAAMLADRAAEPKPNS